MATKTISTWDEFKTAWEELISENTTYYLQNDIDISGIVSSPMSGTSNSGYSKTFTSQGERKKIIGLTYYGSGYFFYKSNNDTIIIDNIAFINCQLPLGVLFAFQDSDAKVMTIQNCIITGNIYTLSGKTSTYTGYSSSAKIRYYRCAINVGGVYHFSRGQTISGGNTTYISYSECWIHINQQYTNGVVRNGGLFSNSIFSQCYFGGTVRTNTSPFAYAYLANCVINMDTTQITANVPLIYSAEPMSGSYAPTGYQMTGTLYSIVNSSISGDNITYTGISHHTIIPLTDAQIKSVSAINELAPNFPISL